MALRRSRRNGARDISNATAETSNRMSRPRRSAGGQDPAMATLSREPPSSPSSQQSLRLTVKLGASKLREATGAPAPRTGRPSVTASSRDPFIGGEILEGKRARNVKKGYVLDSDSEDDEDEEMEDVVEDDDAEGESVDDDGLEDDEVEEDADGDMDMDIPPPPPIIRVAKNAKQQSVVKVKPAGKSDGKTVEQKEAGSDDDLSELDSDMEDQEETMQLDAGDEDAEGDEDEIEVEEDEDELDSDDDTPGGGSRDSTPDITKLTKRQRARLEEGGSGHLLALPDEVQVKKHLTAEEHAMRRAEMARRRKNLSEKRNEEEKMETINKLLKKQAPKTNARRKDLNGNDETLSDEPTAPNPHFTRWVSNKDGNFLGVPKEWLAGPAGRVFAGNGSNRLIEEVQ